MIIIGCDDQAVENSVFRTHSTCEDASNIQNGQQKAVKLLTKPPNGIGT